MYPGFCERDDELEDGDRVMLLDAIRLAAEGAREASDPAALCFGIVKAESPLEILVENRLTLGEAQLIVPRQYRAGNCATHTHGIAAHRHSVPGEAGQTGDTALTTAREMETYAGLQAGDKVVLLRDAGGNRYLILGVLDNGQ